jgi:succinate-semialdehyde dehydrogenase/glutarate-semialdehyde dehydrogenase
MITRKVAPALAACCTIVLTPAEATPLCAKAVFEVFEEAGIPAGVVNMVTAFKPGSIGEAFLDDPRVRKISFTGTTSVGKMLAQGASAQLKRVSLELGGHAPFIVCRDADAIHAAKGLSLAKFLNTGQVCISPGELSKRVAIMKTDSGFEAGVRIDPLVNEAAIEKVDRQVQYAVNKGAELVAGGRRLTEDGLDRGFFYAPTILNHVTPDMTIYREETFGPVAPIVPYQNEDELLSMINDTSYGLAPYVYARGLKKAFAVFEGLHFGIVGINDINPTSAAAPFGGMKESGLGREGAMEGTDEYIETKLGGFSI